MSIFSEIRQHAETLPDEEVCGVVGTEDGELRVRQIPNISENRRENFSMSRADYLQAEKELNILACYHSHPDGDLAFSLPDISASNELNLPYLLCVRGEFLAHVPYLCRQNLFGRPYVPLVYDYLTFVADYLETRGQTSATSWRSLYAPDFDFAAFLPALIKKESLEIGDKPRKGDIVVMSIRSEGVPDHWGVLDERQMLAHHLSEGVSETVSFAGNYAQRALYFLRKKQ